MFYQEEQRVGETFKHAENALINQNVHKRNAYWSPGLGLIGQRLTNHHGFSINNFIPKPITNLFILACGDILVP